MQVDAFKLDLRWEVKKMKKRWILVVCSVCVLFAVMRTLVFLYWFGFPPFYRTVPVTIQQLKALPEFWVGKRVMINGVLSGPLATIPEVRYPYGRLLYDPVSMSEYIGVSGQVSDFAYKNVTLIGVMAKGYTGGLLGGEAVFFIEAEIVELDL
jgi:hypothetical protein